MVFGPDRPYFKQKQKNITKFWPTGFFLIYCFLLFEKNKNKKPHKFQTYINNQNQEAFIVIMINYKLQLFFLCLLCKRFKKNTNPKNQMIFFFFLSIDWPCCFAVLPIDQKIILVLSNGKRNMLSERLTMIHENFSKNQK